MMVMIVMMKWTKMMMGADTVIMVMVIIIPYHGDCGTLTMMLNDISHHDVIYGDIDDEDYDHGE